MKNIVAEINKRFLDKLETKNSWGKNEVKAAYQTIVTEVCFTALEQLDTFSVSFPDQAKPVVKGADFDDPTTVNPGTLKRGEIFMAGHQCQPDPFEGKCIYCGLKTGEAF